MPDTPRMLTIKQTAQTTGLSKHLIRQLAKDGTIVSIQAGTKCLINLDRFTNYLNTARASVPDVATSGNIRRMC